MRQHLALDSSAAVAHNTYMETRPRRSRSQRAAEAAAYQAERAARFAAALAVVASGACPQCGSGLRRNLALTGWWQCEQYGAPGFRRDASRPACEWQGFTS